MSQFSLEQLTEGIRQRHLGSQNRQLTEKWARTGLLRGLSGVKRENMARLMENQASQVLKEQSSLSTGGGATTSSGDMRGFTNIAFPIVRRVFGGLIANDLVSIQPMSLPSGLLFYLDYTRGTNVGASTAADGAAYVTGSSIYNSPAGKGVQAGSDGVGGLYDLSSLSYSRVLKTHSLQQADYHTTGSTNAAGLISGAGSFGLAATGSDAKLVQFDAQVLKTLSVTSGSTDNFKAFVIKTSALSGLDQTGIKDISLLEVIDSNPAVRKTGQALPLGNDADGKPFQSGDASVLNIRRLNQLGTFAGNKFTPAPLTDVAAANAAVLMIVRGAAGQHAVAVGGDASAAAGKDFPGDNLLKAAYPVTASLASSDGSSLVVPAFESNFDGASPSPEIPEIDIKVEALPVVAQTRKLRARWSPELAQDLNAYHSLDAEVELTQILSEQIALEIDREVLNDLLTQASAANYYWSRAPGKFLNKENGVQATQSQGAPAFTGTVREWYETLVETIIDVANQIHRKTLRGSANFIVVGPDVATILEASVLYKPAYNLDGDGQVSGMVIGAEKVGTLSNRFTVYKDPYFPRNKVLVGYKGGSYLETGYVYAPYVPLIVTPTIFAPEDFTPRKGVMTRYGKKMVRSDFYGTVTCADMNII